MTGRGCQVKVLKVGKVLKAEKVLRVLNVLNVRKVPMAEAVWGWSGCRVSWGEGRRSISDES